MSLTAVFVATSISLGLPPGLLDSLCYVESAHRPTAIHRDDGGADSKGICQVQERTARRYGWRPNENLLNPEVNIYYAGRILKDQIDRYHSIVRGVCAYNRGHSTGDGWNNYTRHVFRVWKNQERRNHAGRSH